MQFSWNQQHEQAFLTLKQCLLQSAISCLPDFSPTVKPFVLQTDESAIEIGAVLEQGGQVVAYANYVLTPPEKSYSIIQQEWLAIVYALKQSRHYLLGCHFTSKLVMQYSNGWLLCRRSLSLQEFDFNI